MINTLQLPRRGAGWGAEALWTYIKVPAVGALRYGPTAALALAAAYASAKFAQHATIFPAPLAWLIGISFEWLYLGSLAMSAALKNSKYFRPVNLGGMIVSIIYGTLYAADKYGILAGVVNADLWGIPLAWLFALIHAAPLAGMNFLYNSLIHEYHVEQQKEADKERYKCAVCKRGFESMNGFNGHKRSCAGARLEDV